MDSLQFQKAEFEDTRPKCAGCRNPLEGSYFQLAGANICGSCAEAVRTRQARPGGRALRRGFYYGFGAALGCAVVYSIVMLATGLSMAILSLAVGYIVGKAIRKGTGGLGGRRCQVMAVALTYFAITISYAPLIARGIAEADKHQTPERKQAQEKVHAQLGHAPAPVVVAAGLAAMTAICLGAPLLELSGGVSGIIGLVIILVGLAQAWKMTARDPRLLTGPFAMGEGQPVG